MPRIASLFSFSWSLTLQYRADLLVWLTAMTATPLLSLAIWHATARGGLSLLSPESILTYYLLVMLVRVVTASWRGYELAQEILNGSIIDYLIRPPLIWLTILTSSLTTKILQLLPLVVAAVIVLTAWPAALDFSSFTAPAIAMFIVSLLIAYVVSAAFDLSMGLAAFWIEEAQELMAYRFLLSQFASGVVIPFALMPSWLHATLSWLPFRYTLSAPIEILMGQVTGVAAWQLIGLQGVWALLFIVILRIMYVTGLKRYAVPGQ